MPNIWSELMEYKKAKTTNTQNIEKDVGLFPTNQL